MDLRVKIAGVEFKNPIITASGTFGFGKEYNNFYDVGKLGGICTKGLTLEPRNGNAAPRIAETPAGMLNCVGLQNPGVEEFLREDLPFLKKTGAVVIANVAGSSEADYVEIVRVLSASDVDMIELNISCPNVRCGGMSFGVDPIAVEAITRAVRRACIKPLIVKLTPNVSDIVANALAAQKGGADAVSLINTITGMAIDYKTRKPVLSAVTGGLSGPCVKPVALSMVYKCYKSLSIDIIGLGGIMSGTDVLEFMLAGAGAVQVGTANVFDPLGSLNVLNELTNICENDKINKVSALTGALEV